MAPRAVLGRRWQGCSPSLVMLHWECSAQACLPLGCAMQFAKKHIQGVETINFTSELPAPGGQGAAAAFEEALPRQSTRPARSA